MRKIIYSLFISMALMFSFSNFAIAEDATYEVCSKMKMQDKPAICSKAKKADADSVAKNVINRIIVLSGGLSVLIIVWSGLQYVLSGGDSSKVNRAKTTMIYSVAGLLIAIFAGLIVNFVLSNI